MRVRMSHGAAAAGTVELIGNPLHLVGARELAKLTALGLPIVICVLVDDSLALIELKQRATQRPNLGVEFGGPGRATDFAGLARAFGGHGAEVTDSEALAREATAALTRDRFTLIAARIPRRAYDGAF